MNTEIAIPDATAFEKRALSVLEQAKSIKPLEDDDQYGEVDQWLSSLKSYQKELNATFDPGIKQSNELTKTLREAKARHAVPIEQAETIAKGHLIDYTRRRDAAIEEARRKAQEEADRAAQAIQKAKDEAQRKAREEEERKYKEAQEAARKVREAEEAAAKLKGAARAKAEEAARKAQDEARKAQEAQRQAALATAAATALAEAPVEAVVVLAEAPELKSNTSFKYPWDGMVKGNTDQEKSASLRLLVEAIAAKQAPLSLIVASETEIRKFAQATRGEVQVPGLHFYQKEVASTRSR